MGSSIAAQTGAGQLEPGGLRAATCPLPEVLTVIVIMPVWARDDGVNEAVELGGRPATVKVAGPEGGFVPRLT